MSRRAGLIRALLRRHRRLLARGIAGGLGWQTVGIVTPLVIGWSVEHGITDPHWPPIAIGAAAILALGTFEAWSAAVRHRVACTADAVTRAELPAAILSEALATPPGQARRWAVGELIARSTGDSGQLAGFMDSVCHTVAQACALPVALVLLAVIDPVIGLAAAVGTAALTLAMWRYSDVWERRSAAAQEAFAATTGAAHDAVEGFKVFAGIGAQHSVAARYGQRSEELRDVELDRTRLWVVFEPLLELIGTISIAAVLWIGGERVISGDMSAGTLVTAAGLVLFVADPARTLGTRLITLKMTLASATRIAAVVPDLGRPVAVAAAGRALPIRHLSATAVVAGHEGGPPLGPLSLSAGRGELVVLHGPVGSGKTTLLEVLAGLRPPRAGTVTVDGMPLDALAPADRRASIALLGPSPFLFAGSLDDNLRVGLEPGATTEPELADACRLAELDEFVSGLAHTWETELGERGVTLSGGQRQRLALARTLVRRPPVLLLDGATSALDPAREAAVIANLATAPWRPLVVVVTSNPAVHRIAHRHVHLTGALPWP